MEYIRTIFSKNLRELRKERGLTQVDLAKIAGFQETSYNRWEVGKAWPEPETITALAKALNVPETRFFFDESIITPRLALKALNSLVDNLDKN